MSAACARRASRSFRATAATRRFRSGSGWRSGLLGGESTSSKMGGAGFGMLPPRGDGSWPAEGRPLHRCRRVAIADSEDITLSLRRGSVPLVGVLCWQARCGGGWFSATGPGTPNRCGPCDPGRSPHRGFAARSNHGRRGRLRERLPGAYRWGPRSLHRHGNFDSPPGHHWGTCSRSRPADCPVHWQA